MRIMITGSTSGIGQSLSLDYAQQGHEVIACGRNPDKLQALVDSHKTDLSHSSIEPLCIDLTDYHNFPELDHNKPLDLLILNAGDCEYIDDPLNFDAELFERVININLISIGYALKAWLKNIKPGGRLVLVSSSASFLPLPRAEAYGASKAALTYLGRTLSVDLAQHDIHVSIVHPGFVETPLTERNTFSMPMIISSEVATQRIVNGIAQGKSEIDFPRRFIMLMKLLRMLPTSVWQKLASRMV
ncbi:short-chain dehydrogenase [Vibrio toranzoniae]|uniref:Short-chain dehydrogenase n=1 Tax=Vibrio toranzoniae TaxID=1194427 RepID=A0A109D626_9VIBR|nr:SDR family NAD(P)-dependent oxidoreductase [Vibrio toranzoniae]KWT99548.1 short-chain dehydrogenase [Vibrio toranzoniae]SBS29539.1 D-beta-hydroxybutyrate dehydrogenase [Vibrio toranzoniae]